jgi:hypothetical protein
MASAECPYCVGTGSIKTAESFEIEVMRGIRQMLHSRALARLEVVVPADLSVGILNNRRRELASLEERTDCRIVFTADSLMKARDFRLTPTFRKGERRREEVKPVRPSLLAPLMVEQAKAIQLAKELAAAKVEDLERELAQDPQSLADKAEAKDGEARPAAPAAVPAPLPVTRVAPTVWEEAAVLRRLLFSPNTPVQVAPSAVQAALAPAPKPATNPPSRSHGRRHRRRR